MVNARSSPIERILITGNMGYVGPELVARLRVSRPEAQIIGLDQGFFAQCLSRTGPLPESLLDTQRIGDVRRVTARDLEGIDAVVHLAAVSNDPIGAAFEEATHDINHRASVDLAAEARRAGVRSFVFASSCSIYGLATDEPRTESSELNPLTAYARSKVAAERGLQLLADEGFTVTSLRFATACGMSHRLRLDLVLNDLVAGAITSGAVTLLSDGTPWRPLIHVADMARALDWAIDRPSDTLSPYAALNAGSDEWNHQMRDLASAVAACVPGVEVRIADGAGPDPRSYRVSFARFRDAAPDHQPQVSLEEAIHGLAAEIALLPDLDANYRQSRFVRLNVLRDYLNRGDISESLEWTSRDQGASAVPAAAAL